MATFWQTGKSRMEGSKSAIAFSLLVYTRQPLSTRLFLKKSRTSLNPTVQSRSENALEGGRKQTFYVRGSQRNSAREHSGCVEERSGDRRGTYRIRALRTTAKSFVIAG
jgi:hypothetical protein